MKPKLTTEQKLRKVIRRIIKEELNEGKREIRQTDLIDRYYPQLKRMIDDGQGEFNKVVREIDKRWEGPYTDVYDVVELISDAADAARVSFNYNRMESDLVSLFKYA